MPNAELKSIWEATTERYPYPTFSGDLSVDVAIIGGGITGLTAALFLKKAGKSIAVLEARHLGAGTTGATTAHLTAAYDHDYAILEKAYKPLAAKKVCESLSFAIDSIEGIVNEYRIDCDFSRLNGYYYAETDSEAENLQKEYEAAHRAGLDCMLVSTLPFLPFSSKIAMEIKRQAQFHAGKYLQGLAKIVAGDGCYIFENSRVIDYSSRVSPSIVTTSAGSVSAQNIIMATHSPLGKSVLHSAIEPFRSYVLAAKIKGEVPTGLFWDLKEPYNYTRRLETKDGPLLIVGGKDHKTGHEDEKRSLVALEDYVRSRYQVEQICFRWSGQYYDPVGHLPFIGKMPLAAHAYVGTGYSGDGMTFGSLAGWILAEQVLARATPYDELYKPARLHTAGLKKLLKVNLQVSKTFVKDHIPFPGSGVTIERLRPGEGCVTVKKGNHIAAYRDETGHIRTFSAVCPHMRCNVRWNSLQKSFDCPCHGSRFDTEGYQIEGPSLAGLIPLRLKELDQAQ